MGEKRPAGVQDVSQHIIGYRERMPTAIRIIAGDRSKV
jgi:hypothetical protein